MQNLIIKGNEPLTEEHYENLTVNGSTQPESPLEVDNLTVNGFLKCFGDFTCNELLVCKGTTRLTGNVKLKDLICSGAFFSSGEQGVKANNITASGAVKFSSDLTLDTLTITNTGSFTIKDDGCVQARAINSEGSVTINNTIEAETVNSFGFIYADTIVAKSVYIRSKKTIISKELKTQGVDTTIPTIIADEVELVNVRVHEVKAKNVKIGANCKIDKIEYTRNIEIDESSKVGEVEKK